MEQPVLHDCDEPRAVLQDADVRERIAVDEQQVGEIALLHLSELAVLAAGKNASGYALRVFARPDTKADNSFATEPDSSICS